MFMTQLQKLVRSRKLSRQAPGKEGEQHLAPFSKLITSLLLEIPQEPLLAREKCIPQFRFFISGEYRKQ
jgi:hypothetical protein